MRSPENTENMPTRSKTRSPVDANTSFYRASNLLGRYDNPELRPVEEVLFERYRGELSGRVLDVGCGAGRLIGHLDGIAEQIHGIDVSERMVAHCRSRYPRATFSQADMRDLTSMGAGQFDVVIASFNVLDAVDHADRRRTLDGFRRVLAPGGLLIMSSHNLASAGGVVGPWAEVMVQLRSRRLRGFAGSVLHLLGRTRNHHRLKKLETSGPGYRILNDPAHDYSLLHYYVSPSRQVRQLSGHGFVFLECLDLDGRQLEVGDPPSGCTELHYVARLPAGS